MLYFTETFSRGRIWPCIVGGCHHSSWQKKTELENETLLQSIIPTEAEGRREAYQGVFVASPDLDRNDCREKLFPETVNRGQIPTFAD